MGVKDFVKKSANFLWNELNIACEQKADEIYRDGYFNGRNEGIQNTVKALYDANVSDAEIIRVLHKVWNISELEARERLVSEKPEAAIHEMRKYLYLQGYSLSDVRSFIEQTDAITKIRSNPKLWELRKTPKKLVEIVQGNNSTSEQSEPKARKKQNRK